VKIRKIKKKTTKRQIIMIVYYYKLTKTQYFGMTTTKKEKETTLKIFFNLDAIRIEIAVPGMMASSLGETN